MTDVASLVRRVTPRQVSVAVLAVAIGTFAVVGRQQWFIRDDWAFVLTRRALRERFGVGEWLFTAQDGHWMTPPLLVYWAIEQVFGLGSYWPFLVANMALHVAAVVLVRELCRRTGVSEWTTVMVCSLLLLFGSGWENIVFAVQVTYNLSLVAFLAHLVLVDHDGPVGRRDVAGAAVGIVGVASSAFGPFFAVGVFAVLCWRRRWRAAVVAAAPQAIVYSWWLFTWGNDPTGDDGSPSLPGALRFARLAVTATLNGMTGQILFAGAAFFGIVVVVFVTPLPERVRSMATVLAVLPVPVLLAIGWQRAVLGLDAAASARYQYMTAMVIGVPFALAIDQLRRLDRRAIVVGWALIGVSVVSNVRLLVTSSDVWADRSAGSRRTFELVAGSAETAAADGTLVMESFDPDVTIEWLPFLVDEGMIEPRTPVTPDEIELVRSILAGTPRP